MNAILKLIDQIFSSLLGKLIFSLFALLFSLIIHKLLKENGKKDSSILKDAFKDYRQKTKLMVTTVGIYLICIFDLLNRMDSYNLIKLILSNAVFIIIAIIDTESNFNRLNSKKDLQYLILLNTWMASAMSFMCISLMLFKQWLFSPQIHFSISYILSCFLDQVKMERLFTAVFGVILDIPIYFLFAPITIISIAVDLNYIILYFLVQKGIISKNDTQPK